MKIKGILDWLIDNESLLYKMAFVLIVCIFSFSAYFYIDKAVETDVVFVAVGITVVFGLVLIALSYKKQKPNKEEPSLTIDTMTGIDIANFTMKRTELRIKAALDNNDGSLIKELTLEEWIEKYN